MFSSSLLWERYLITLKDVIKHASFYEPSLRYWEDKYNNSVKQDTVAHVIHACSSITDDQRWSFVLTNTLQYRCFIQKQNGREKNK